MLNLYKKWKVWFCFGGASPRGRSENVAANEGCCSCSYKELTLLIALFWPIDERNPVVVDGVAT